MNRPESRAPELAADVQREILRAVANIDYGSVEVIVHNHRVVQIEVRTKKRFEAASPLR